MANDEEYLVLRQHDQKLDHAMVQDIRQDRWSRSACLAEPFGPKMGRFSYDDLLQRGYAESQGYTVYKKDFWRSNRDAEIEKYRKRHSKKSPFVIESDPNEISYRRLLGLPEDGALLKSEIEQAYKICARSAHPDAGGSQEGFQKLGTAKEALVRNLQH